MEILSGPMTPYVLWLAAAMAGCASLAFFRLKGLGLNAASRAALIAASLFLGFLVAHLLYCLMSFTLTLEEYGLGYFFAFYKGRYMLFGAVAGVCLGTFIVSRLSGQGSLPALDALAPVGALMIALARFLEGLNGQGFGPDVELEALQFFPLSIFDGYYETWYFALFVVEGLWALMIALWLFKKKAAALPGDRLWLLLLLYSAGQILFESLRQDDVLRWGFVRCSQVISALVVAAALLFYQRQRKAAGPGRIALEWAALLGLMGVCMAMEFAREQKIELLLWMNEPMCYGTMLAAIAGLVALVFSVRKKGQAQGLACAASGTSPA